jgi:hypothetical protein
MTTRRLIIAVCLASLSANAAPQGKSARREDPDMKEVTAFKLSMDNVNKFISASTALAKLQKENPDMRKSMDQETGPKTIDNSVKAIEKYPPVLAAIKDVGLSPREYVVMTGTLMGATMAVGMKKQGQLKEIPPSVSPENAAFVEQNYDKINASMTKLMSRQQER